MSTRSAQDALIRAVGWMNGWMIIAQYTDHVG
jgi:hypothetical protein